MRKFPRPVLAIFAVAVAASVAVGRDEREDAEGRGDHAQICVLLPDTKSSVRWETQDRPLTRRRVQAAGDTYIIVNAGQRPQKQRTQAEQCLDEGRQGRHARLARLGLGAAIEKRPRRRARR